MRAAANTPADPVGALIARFPADGSLPRFTAGSASALPVSRPAQRSLSLRPAWSLSHPRRPFCIGVLQTMSLPPSSAPTATGWSDSCRAGFAPAEGRRLRTAHGKDGVVTHFGAPRGRCSPASIADSRIGNRPNGTADGSPTTADVEGVFPVSWAVGQSAVHREFDAQAPRRSRQAGFVSPHLRAGALPTHGCGVLRTSARRRRREGCYGRRLRVAGTYYRPSSSCPLPTCISVTSRSGTSDRCVRIGDRSHERGARAGMWSSATTAPENRAFSGPSHWRWWGAGRAEGLRQSWNDWLTHGAQEGEIRLMLWSATPKEVCSIA